MRTLRLFVLAAALPACLTLPPVSDSSRQLNGDCVALRAQGDAERAEAACQKALEYSPNNGEAWVNLGLLRYDRKDVRGAKDALREALRVNPDQLQALSTLCAIYLVEERNLTKAEWSCRAALRVDPAYAQAQHNLFEVLWAKGQKDAARAVLLSMTVTHPELAEPWCQLGHLEVLANRPREALRYLDQAVALTPGYALAQQLLGVAHEQLGELALAADGYGACLDAEAGDEVCRQGLTRVKRTQSQEP